MRAGVAAVPKFVGELPLHLNIKLILCKAPVLPSGWSLSPSFIFAVSPCYIRLPLNLFKLPPSSPFSPRSWPPSLAFHLLLSWTFSATYHPRHVHPLPSQSDCPPSTDNTQNNPEHPYSSLCFSWIWWLKNEIVCPDLDRAQGMLKKEARSRCCDVGSLGEFLLEDLNKNNNKKTLCYCSSMY